MAVALDYLIPYLRLRIGDTNSSSYRYIDEWLKAALLLSVKNLAHYWNYKYLVDDSNRIYRNPHITYLFSEPPVIEPYDENIIIVMATIIILEGSLENSAWNAVSWRDAEIAYSNLEQFRSRDASLRRLIDELNSLIKPPVKRLGWPTKRSLPGFRGNAYEYGNNSGKEL